MSTQQTSLEGKLMTVRGPIDPDEMGITLPHEHLLMHHTAPEIVLADPDAMAEELSAFGRAGGGTVVEVSSRGLRRDPEGLKSISEQSGVHVVMACGYYKKAWHPEDMDGRTVDSLSEEMVADILDGVGDTGIHAGIIGEVGVTDSLTGNERKSVIASARAQQETGAAINFHVHLLDKPAEEDLRSQVMDLIASEGADLNRVVMSHFEPAEESLDYHERMASRGIYIEYDLFGMAALEGPDIPDYRMESRAFRQLIDRGCLGRILISHDICFRKLLVRNGGWGYAHILDDVVPRLQANGITESEIHAILVDNPKRVFPLSRKGAPDG